MSQLTLFKRTTEDAPVRSDGGLECAAGGMRVHFSSETDLWYTPQDFYDEMNDEFSFATDVCATDDNAKCANYYTEEQDGYVLDEPALRSSNRNLDGESVVECRTR